MEKIDSVAGPEVTDDHMSETVHRSAMEGGDALPSRRRDIIDKGFNPSFDASKQASTVPASSGDAAEADSKVKGDAKKAKESVEKAETDAKDAKMAAMTAASKAADKSKTDAKEAKVLSGKKISCTKERH